MRQKFLYLMPLLLFSTACKMVNTHTVRIISHPVTESGSIRFEINKGQTLQLKTASCSLAQQKILQDIQPGQCLDITTSEPFNMQNGMIRFTDFKFKKLVASDSKCRKLRPQTGIRIRVNP